MFRGGGICDIYIALYIYKLSICPAVVMNQHTIRAAYKGGDSHPRVISSELMYLSHAIQLKALEGYYH